MVVNPVEKEKRYFIIFGFLIISCLFVGALWYVVRGHALVQAMYEGRSFQILNNLIASRENYPLKFYLDFADRTVSSALFSLPLFFIMVLFVFRPRTHMNTCASYQRWGEIQNASLDRVPQKHLNLWIGYASGLALFAELLIIRLHGSYFQLFAYFKNISLLSCFLGLGIGFTQGEGKRNALPLVIPLMSLQVIFMELLRKSPVERFFHNPISEQIGFGIAQATNSIHIGSVYIFLVVIFSFNALCFIPFGQTCARLMIRQDTLIGYCWNLLGSLCGIVLFTLISFLWTPPLVWMVLLSLGVIALLDKKKKMILPSIISMVVLIMIMVIPFRLGKKEVYSPYQLVSLSFAENTPIVKVSNTYHQAILDLRDDHVTARPELKRIKESYELPYLLVTRPDEVLVVGSGTGNDVAAALRHEAKHIDAVEIDPAILQFGKELHPEFPYLAPEVKVVLNDARMFLRETEKRYDLIVYGALDSHALLSGRSGGIRLDSYVYTVEGLRQAREKLKENGIISLSFGAINDALSRKLYLMLREIFDEKNIAVFERGRIIFLAGKDIQQKVAIAHIPYKNMTAAVAADTIPVSISTDNWPFFYMPIRKYPLTYVWMIGILLCVSSVFIRNFVIRDGESVSFFSLPPFFLGAGFMLLETKAITELTLFFGATWVVVSIVIAAILILAFIANAVIIRYGKRFNPSVSYGLLLASLMLGWGITFVNMYTLSLWGARLCMTLILTMPIFFAGLSFSGEVRQSSSLPVALASNLFGAMVGGFLEYNSMYFGFRTLYLFAFMIYACAWISSYKKRVTVS